jgi:hypothetical protein
MPVRDDSATTPCPVCGVSFEPIGRQRFCGTTCRQAGWRRKRAAPVEPIVAKSDTATNATAAAAVTSASKDATSATPGVAGWGLGACVRAAMSQFP